MKNKKFLIAISILFASIIISFAFANQQQFDIKINNEPFVISPEMGEVHIKNGRVMVPLRAFIDNLKLDINWNSDTKTISIPYKSGIVSMEIDKDTYINQRNEVINLDSPPYILDGRTYIPLRALAEILDYELEYTTLFDTHKISLTKLETPKSKYTIMIYINASDLESSYGSATDSINEIISSNVGDDINIIVETGGTTNWKKSEISESSNQRHLIKNGELVTVENDLGIKNMGDSQTLADFIDYSVENYEAEKYALILWSHGFGPVDGFGADSLFDNDSLTLLELEEALQNKPVKYEFIGFDSCLMGSIETATLFKDYSKYLIASEDLVYSGSWDYRTWILQLNLNPDIEAYELGKLIVDSYQKKYNYSEPVLALTDLSQIDNINKELSNLSVELIELIERWPFEEFYNARYNTSGFADIGLKAGAADMVDIIELSRVIDEYIYPQIYTEKLTQALEKAVYPKSPYNDTPTNGLSIYLPFKNMLDIDNRMEIYKQTKFNQDYLNFLELYVAKLKEYNEQFIIK